MQKQSNGPVFRTHQARFSVSRIVAGLCFLFAGGAFDAIAQVKLLYTDFTVEPGRIYYSIPSGEQTLYRAPAGRIYYAAVGPDGALYYSDANKDRLLRAVGNQVTVVYTHTTYLRDIAFDPQGQLFFSESTGAFANGRIYRLNNGVAELFFTVNLASMHGFWAGNFAFAPDGTLYLSTGNQVGAHIYRVTAGVASSVYSAPLDSIAGFDFDSAGNIYFADWFHRIYRLTPAFVRTVVLEDSGRRFADVNVLTTSIALGPEAGRVNSVVLNPANPNIMYSGTSSGSVFRSHDGGLTWYWRGSGITDPRIGEMVVYPPDPVKVLAVTPSGVFRSANEGRSWSQVLNVTQPLPQPSVFSLRLLWLQKNPIRYTSVDGALYAAPFCSGLFKSTDTGTSWTQVYGAGMTVLDKCVTSIDFSTEGGGTVFITTPSGIRTSVGGGTWTPMGAEINDAVPVALKVAPSLPSRIYVAATGLGAPPYHPNLWRRDSAGGVFTRTSLAPPWLDWFGMDSLAVHPTNPDRVYAGSIPLYTSPNAGATWTTVSSGCGSSLICGVDYHGLTFDATGNLFYAAHDQGIFRYNATSGVFTAVENGLVNTQFYNLDVGTGGTIYAGTQDKHSYKKVGLNDWEHVDSGGSGDVLDMLVDPTNDDHLFLRTNTEDVLHSADGGAHSTPSGFVPGQGFWNHQLAYHGPSTTLYVGTQFQGVYKSTNDGATFSPANTGIENRRIRCLALQPGSNMVAYAGTFNDGLYKTVNGGGNWTKLTSFPQPGALVIAINPDATRIYAGTAAGIFRSSDGGTSWSAASTGLPALSVVGEIIVDQVCPCALYAGLGYYDFSNLVGGGVYQSIDGGNSWGRLSSPSDAVMTVTSIRIDPNDRSRLLLATYGSGIRALFRDIPGGCSCT